MVFDCRDDIFRILKDSLDHLDRKHILSVEWWKTLFSFPSCESVNQTKGGGQVPGQDTDLQLALWSSKEALYYVQHFVSFSSVLVSHNCWRNCLSLLLLHVLLCSPAALLLSCLPFGAGQWVLTEMAAENHAITVWKQPESKLTHYSHCPAKQWAGALYRTLQIILCRCDPFHILYTL